MSIRGAESEVLGAEAGPDSVSRDQVKVRIPRSLEGRGEFDVVLTVEGKPANTVTVNIR